MWYTPVSKHFRGSSRAIASQFLRPKRLAIFEACLIGLVCGLAGVLLKLGVGWLGSWRVSASMIVPAWLLLPSVGLLGGLLTGFLVERLAPETAGSGIPHVKAALAGVGLPLNLRVAIAKLIGTILAVGSGLTLGRQGPTVQIGASLAAWISNWIPTSPEYRRQLIACGAAAGLAAGFNAPIAGVLFVVEELLQDVSGLTLGTAIVSSFIGAVVSQQLGGNSLNLNISTHQSSFVAQEIPFYIVLGVFAGLLGALFAKSIIAVLKFNKRLHLGLPFRVALAGFICGLAVAALPENFRNNTGLREFLLTGEASAQTSFVAFIAHFVLTSVAAGSGAPGGLFAPSLVLGSALGHIVGILQENLLGLGVATTYALAGMGAFFCAVTRAPITAVVIVFEIATDFKLVLPLMICCAIAYLVAEKVDSESLYDRLLDFNGISLKKEKPANDALRSLHAADVMQRRVETLSSQMTLDEAIQAFSRSHHRGFPVVDSSKLVGIITQTDLAQASTHNLPGATLLQEIMTPQPMTVQSRDRLSEILCLLNRHNLSRLPVTEGRHLVGIITRSDIIRAEADQLTGGSDRLGPHPEPSYIVYQTKSPQVGSGRLLVPLSNPQTAPALLRVAAAIARDRNCELECLQVILVPRNSSPSETSVRTTKSRRLLQQAERIARNWGVPIHTQVRLAHDVAHAILETIKERHIDLILMGWQGESSTPDRIFGNVVDTVIRQASCEVVLVKWSEKLLVKNQKLAADEVVDKLLICSEQPISQDSLNVESPLPSDSSPIPKPDIKMQELGVHTLMGLHRWLVPIRGDYKQAAAVKLLPALVALSGVPEIRLCQVHQPSKAQPHTGDLKEAQSFLKRRLSCPIMATPVCAKSVSDALINLAQNDQCDVIVLGASREGLLKQVMHGNIPEAVARGCDCTVILVRGTN